MMMITKEMDMVMDTDTDGMDIINTEKVDMEMVPLDMDMIKEMLLLGFMEKDSMKFHTKKLIIMD